MKNPVAIEVCERLADSHLIPQRDAQGNCVIIRGIVPHVRAPKYHAQIKGQGGFWGCGNSRDEAIGSLIAAHPEQFGIAVSHLGKEAR